MGVSPIAYLDYNLSIIRRAILMIGKSTRIETYLDLGCGSATLTEFVNGLLKPKHIICIDIDPQAISIAKGKGYTAYQVDLNYERIPMDDSSVDLVTAFEVIEHLHNKDNLFEEVHRILRPGGFFVLSTPNLLAWVNRVLMLFGKSPLEYGVSQKYLLKRPSYGHVNLYTPELLIEHLRAVGFEPLNMYGLLTHYSLKNYAIKMLTMAITKLRPTLAPDLLVIARKKVNIHNN